MSKQIQIEGIAIVEGLSRNGVMYKAEELDKFAHTLVGRPILKDHNSITDNTIGLVTEGKSIDGGKKVRYKGWIKEDGTGIVDRIKDGRIKEVSIGATAGKLIKESEDDEYVIAKDMVALELSTTPTPGVIGTSLGYSEENIKQIIKTYEAYSSEGYTCSDCDKKFKTKKEMTDHKKVHMDESCSHSHLSEDILIEKEDKMENNEVKESKVEVNNEVVELKAKLEEANKLVLEMKEAQRQDAITAYKAICKAKGLTEVDASAMTMETIKALSAQVESFVMPSVKEEVEAAPEEEKSEEVKDEEKEVAVPQTQEVEAEEEVNESFGGYRIEHSDLGGWSFYKTQ